MIKKLVLAALTAAFIFPQTVGAVTDAQATSHNALIDALNRAGVQVYADADECSKGKVSGFYHNPSKSLVLCNNGSKEMTDKNLDTLRHEAIHVLQDLCNGKVGDNKMSRVLKPGKAIDMLQAAGLSADGIRDAYKARGASDFVVDLELEAWGGAASLSAETITIALDTICASK